MRRAAVLAACLVCLVATAFAEDFDIGNALKPSFHDLALLPTRLTAYNQHDDAANASYTCCKIRQEAKIKAAIEAGEAFLNRFSDTAFADNTYMHYGRVSELRPDSFRNMEWAYRSLTELYPDSDLADDAAWRLGSAYCRDHDHENAIKVFEYINAKWPQSTWADDALHSLIEEYTYTNQERAALNVLNELAYKYPQSEFCPEALFKVARKYMEVEDYRSAINACRDLIRDFPFNDQADDAQMCIAECYRLMGDLQGSLDAYRELINRWYGSNLSNRAMREANDLMKRIQGGDGRTAGALYDPLRWDPQKEAEEMWNREAKHLQNNGAHLAAIAKFREFIQKFPGNDLWDDAWYEIGMTYMRQDQLFQDVNNAKGPDDIARLREDYQMSTGDKGPVPTNGKLSALRQAQEAFAYIANNLKGSSLQCQALGMVARCFIPYGGIEDVTTRDAAYTYQEIITGFPFASIECPWFPDATWPVYALCRLVHFYADPANWDDAQLMYPELSAAYPGVFPANLEKDKTSFYELMKLYDAKTDHAYLEMSHHIRYGVSIMDLVPEAHYYQAAMLMNQGDFKRAAELLVPVTQLKGHDLVAPATYLYAQACVKLGQWEQARAAFATVAEKFKSSGLADDAATAWSQYVQWSKDPKSCDIAEACGQVRQKFGIDPATMDVYAGENCVVFCPYTRAALMRQYNMPNVWDEGQRVLRDWAGLPLNQRAVIVVDRDCASTSGNPFKVQGCEIKDPPEWNLGLSQIAANVLAEGIPQLGECKGLLGGIANFVAASLQYDLVTETRDAIGSAAAVKLPQEEVIRARDNALKALENYVIAGEDGKLDSNVIAGMMYSLLDSHGFSKDRLIDREPYRAFFAKLKQLPAKTADDAAFAQAVVTAFGDDSGEQLKKWRMSVPQVNTAGGAATVSMVP
jgi:TolA-binding protein